MTSRYVRKEFDMSARSYVLVGTVHPSSVLEVKGKNVAQFGVRPSESGVGSLPRLVSVAPLCLRVASVHDPESVHIDDPDIEHEAEIAGKPPESEMQELSSEELIQNQLRMCDVEFGRVSGNLVPSQSNNGTESEEDDALSILREIGAHRNISRLDFVGFASSNHSLADLHSPLPQTFDASHFEITPPRLVHSHPHFALLLLPSTNLNHHRSRYLITRQIVWHPPDSLRYLEDLINLKGWRCRGALTRLEAHEGRRCATNEDARRTKMRDERRCATNEDARKTKMRDERRCATNEDARRTKMRDERRCARNEDARRTKMRDERRCATNEDARRTKMRDERRCATNEDARRTKMRDERRCATNEDVRRTKMRDERRCATNEDARRTKMCEERRCAKNEDARRTKMRDERRCATNEDARRTKMRDERRCATNEDARRTKMCEERRCAKNEDARRTKMRDERRCATNEDVRGTKMREERRCAKNEDARRTKMCEERRCAKNEDARRTKMRDERRCATNEDARRTKMRDERRCATNEDARRTKMREERRCATNEDVRGTKMREERRCATNEDARRTKMRDERRCARNEDARRTKMREERRCAKNEDARRTKMREERRCATNEDARRTKRDRTRRETKGKARSVLLETSIEPPSPKHAHQYRNRPFDENWDEMSGSCLTRKGYENEKYERRDGVRKDEKMDEKSESGRMEEEREERMTTEKRDEVRIHHDTTQHARLTALRPLTLILCCCTDHTLFPVFFPNRRRLRRMDGQLESQKPELRSIDLSFCLIDLMYQSDTRDDGQLRFSPNTTHSHPNHESAVPQRRQPAFRGTSIELTGNGARSHPTGLLCSVWPESAVPVSEQLEIPSSKQ
ncbi:hypothetical protein BLNAU_6015 [Blattamonas nauphoetae]|uniref:Uncharacterized protein n=1 Tax=Blattamonas nauphoetae TaxID=2049346 RepID=A0ABQ9Y5L6_9EUKA|nr:hypothetical protein BLNAU_6015 [Blattamonas nauphoetae]